MHFRGRKSPGLTLAEIILVCAISCVLLGIIGIGWQRASALRKADAAIFELESAFVLARQTAQNRNGAYITLNPPTAESDGSWELHAGSSNAGTTSPALAIGKFDSKLTVSLVPENAHIINLNSAGCIDKKLTPTDSEGNCAVIISVTSENSETSIKIIGMTGAVMKVKSDKQTD